MAARSPLADLSPEDRRRFYDLTLGFVCVAAAALIGRTVGDALFLAEYSADDLAYMYPATAALICIIAYGYGRLASRLPLARLVTGLALLLAAVCLGLRAAFWLPEDSAARVAAYLVGDLVVNLPMLLFWSFAAHCFRPGQAKRLFGLVGAGGTTACILAGFVVNPFSAAFGTPNLLGLIALLLGGFALLVNRTSRRDGIGRRPPDGGADRAIGSLSSLLQRRQIRAVFGLMLIATVTLTLVDYQFKAGTRLNVEAGDLASFFGTFYGAASAVSLGIQLFLVHRILQKGGVFAGLVILPAALVVTSGVAWITGEFAWTVATKFAVQIFAFTVDIAAIQLLYLGIARQTRSQARALAEGIGKPLATGLTGLCLIIFADASTLYTLALIAGAAGVAWCVLARYNHVTYIRSLTESLERGQFDISEEVTAVHDVTLEKHLREALRTAADEDVVYLLGVLPTLEHVDWLDDYRGLLSRDDPQIKTAALLYLHEHGTQDDLPAVADLLTHPDRRVREAAIDTLAALGTAEQHARIEDCLNDPAPEARAAAVAALLNAGDLDGLLSAGAVLRDMLDAPAVPDRIAAARALGRLKQGGLVRSLVGLLQDDDPSVLRAALEACDRQTDPKLIAAITPLLANPKVAALAGDALANFGSAALDHLIPYIDLAETEGAFPGAHGIPPVLAAIGDPAAIRPLVKASGSPDPRLRASAVRAVTRLIERNERVREMRDVLENTALQELRASRHARERAVAFSGDDAALVLRDALNRDADRHLENAFVLLDPLTPSVRMNTLYASLSRDDDARSSAVEVLENVLKGRLRDEVSRTLSPGPPDRRVDPDREIVGMLESPGSDWVRIGALYTLRDRTSLPRDAVVETLRHDHPVARETALAALVAHDPHAAVREARTLLDDEAEIVRSLATEVLKTETAK